MRKTISILVLGTALVGPAGAADFGMYGTAGTLGLGGGVAATFGPHFGARLGYTTYTHDVEDIEETDLTLDGTVELGGAQALLDWYPFGGGFRFTLGAVQSPDISARARPVADSYTFDGVTYSADDIGEATGNAEFDSVAAYAGLGYGRALSSDGRFAFAADLGVAFTGAPDVKLSVTCQLSDPTLCAELANDVAAEQAELQQEADEFEYWPVLSIGVSYRF